MFQELGLSPNNKKILSGTEVNVFSSAMQCMQKSQCYSKYARYQSPAIISARVSPDYLKFMKVKGKKKSFLPPIEKIVSKKRVGDEKQAVEPRVLKGRAKSPEKVGGNEEKCKEFYNLEVTGLARHQGGGEGKIIDRKKQEHELRRMSISFLENKRKELYYEKYHAKQQQLLAIKTEKMEAGGKERKRSKLRCATDTTQFIEDNVETCEISLQTPSYFYEDP